MLSCHRMRINLALTKLTVINDNNSQEGYWEMTGLVVELAHFRLGPTNIDLF